MDLDRSKPFGTVYGVGPAHSFEQDGRFFDNQGNEIHVDGTPVSAKEKMERTKKNIEALEAKKKALLRKEMEELQKNEDELKVESHKIYVNEAAKNIHRLVETMDNMKSKADFQEALDELGYPYDEAATKADLEAVLEEIFIAAG